MDQCLLYARDAEVEQRRGERGQGPGQDAVDPCDERGSPDGKRDRGDVYRTGADEVGAARELRTCFALRVSCVPASPSVAWVKKRSIPYAPAAPAAKRKTRPTDGVPRSPIKTAPVDHTVIA
jgi:hypothetical protein